MSDPRQLELFSAVQDAYASSDGAVPNEELYAFVQERGVYSESEMAARETIGATGQKHSTAKRACRWIQQTLKQLGLLERVDRALWTLTGAGKEALTRIERPYRVLGFSTELGIAVLGNCQDVFGRLKEDDISLCICSPPYPIQRGRAYGTWPDPH